MRLIQAGAKLTGSTVTAVVLEAIGQGFEECLRLIFKSCIDIDTRLDAMYWQKMTPLMIAIQRNQLALVKSFVEWGADLNTTVTTNRLSALGMAIHFRRLDLAQFLFMKGAWLNAEEISNPARLLRQIYDSKDILGFTRLMIDAGIQLGEDIHIILREVLPQDVHKISTRTSLQQVLYAVTWLRDPLNPQYVKPEKPLGDYASSSRNTATSSDNTATVHKSNMRALYIAVTLDNVALATELVRTGANVNARVLEEDAATPLQQAVCNRSLPMVTLLLDSGSLINAYGTKKCGTSLQEAVRADDALPVKLLLDSGADVNAPASGPFNRTALQHAVYLESLSLLQMLLQAGADVDEVDTGEPLRVAVEEGFFDIVDALLNFGATTNPSWSAAHGRFTPLQTAVQNQNYEMAHRLLQAGAAIDAGSTDARGTALQAAAKQGHRQIVQLLLRSGATLDAICNENEYGTALHEAFVAGHYEVALLLLEHGADSRIPGPVTWTLSGWYIYSTVLQMAIDAGDLDLAKELMNSGAEADVVITDEEEVRTPLLAAMEHDSKLGDSEQEDRTQALKLVISAGADVDQPVELSLEYPFRWQCYGPPLIATVLLGRHAQARELIAAGADVNASAEIFEGHSLVGHLTPLQAVVANSDEFLVQMLLEAGGDTGVATRFPYLQEETTCFGTLLAVAVSKSSSDRGIVNLLLRHGAPVDLPATGNLGRAALQAAAEIGDSELVERLIKLGSDVNASPSEEAGATAFQLAVMHGYAGIAAMLLDAGADPFVEGAADKGRTALEAAVENGRTDMVVFLLDVGETLDLPAT